MENEIITKELEAALKSFEVKNSQVPEGYFDQFEMNLMRKIQAEKNAPKQAKILSIFSAQKKYLVAASLILVVAIGSILYDKANNKLISKGELVQIEALPDESIEAYLNDNEVLTEVDWSDAIEAVAIEVNLIN